MLIRILKIRISRIHYFLHGRIAKRKYFLNTIKYKKWKIPF